MNIIICGAGRVGFTIAKLLVEQNHSITVIDQSSEDIQKINERFVFNNSILEDDELANLFEEIEEVKYQYKISMMIIGMALAQQNSKKIKKETDSTHEDLSELSMNYTKLIAPLLLPIVRDIGTIFH